MNTEEQFLQLKAALNIFSTSIEIDEDAPFEYNLKRYIGSVLVYVFYYDEAERWFVSKFDAEAREEEIIYVGEYNLLELVTKFTNTCTVELLKHIK